MFKPLLPTLMIIALAGCQSGTSPVVPMPNPPGGTLPVGPVSGATYRTLDSTAAATGILGSVGTSANGSTLQIRSGAGLLEHNTGGTVVRINGADFVDPDGPDATGVLSNGTTNVTTRRATGYEYVTAYVQRTADAAATSVSTGFFGIATLPADMPTTGTATYNGNASVRITGATPDRFEGVSVVNADFGAGQVDVGLSGFPSSAAIDNVSVTQMAISGSSMTGGNVSLTNGGVSVDLTGPNSTASALGRFYGLSGTDGNPAEVAGNIIFQGDTGAVQSSFFAD